MYLIAKEESTTFLSLCICSDIDRTVMIHLSDNQIYSQLNNDDDEVDHVDGDVELKIPSQCIAYKFCSDVPLQV